jgi:hypothetical protein
MIDITTTRSMALQTHPPGIIYALLFSLALMCSLLGGYGMSVGRNRSWLHIISFTVMTIIVIYVIMDIEYPRAGLIRLHAFDQALIDVRERMQETSINRQ